MPDFLSELIFIFERLTWLSLLDILLVTIVIFSILIVVRDARAVMLLRGMAIVIILLSLLTSLVNLPAFSWLISTILPTLFLAIPVIFAPEIRRGLERLGRAGSTPVFGVQRASRDVEMEKTIHTVVTAAARLSARQHGALIVFQRIDGLEDYLQTGVRLNAAVTAELILQIFYPNTPLHDGAVIIADNKIVAASAVMPLSSSGVLNRSVDRRMGLRHRAGLGISEASDAIAVVVSEETGSISIAHNGHMIRRLDTERLENILTAFFQPSEPAANIIDAILQPVRRIFSPRQHEE